MECETDANITTICAFLGYLIGCNSQRSAISQNITYCTHPDKPLTVTQSDSTVTTVSVEWTSPDDPPTGYIITNYLTPCSQCPYI